MLDDLEARELSLRRRLLFKLLDGFDFDRPCHRYEHVTEPMPEPLAREALRTYAAA